MVTIAFLISVVIAIIVIFATGFNYKDAFSLLAIILGIFASMNEIAELFSKIFHKKDSPTGSIQKTIKIWSPFVDFSKKMFNSVGINFGKLDIKQNFFHEEDKVILSIPIEISKSVLKKIEQNTLSTKTLLISELNLLLPDENPIEKYNEFLDNGLVEPVNGYIVVTTKGKNFLNKN